MRLMPMSFEQTPNRMVWGCGSLAVPAAAAVGNVFQIIKFQLSPLKDGMPDRFHVLLLFS